MRNIGAVILAAGGSSRLGQPKQLLRFRGETLVRRAVRAAAEAGCKPILAIVGDTGASGDTGEIGSSGEIGSIGEIGSSGEIGASSERGDAIKESLDIRDSRIASSFGEEGVVRPTVIENADWRLGIGTSIRRGMEQLPKEIDAAVVLTCDQPFLDASIVRQLIVAQEETGKPIVASSYANTLGVPALFDRSCFDALLALPAGAGAKAFILSRRGEVASVPFVHGEIDIDTPEDLERLTTL